MALADLLSQSVTVLHFREDGAADGYGNLTPVWDLPTVHRARLEQVGGSEVTVGASVQVADWDLYLVSEDDAARQIKGRDRVLADGVTYEVVGPPTIHRAPRGKHHVEARLRVVEP